MSYAGCFARRCVETRRERFGDMENGRSFHSNCIMTIVNRLALRVLSLCTLLIPVGGAAGEPTTLRRLERPGPSRVDIQASLPIRLHEELVIARPSPACSSSSLLRLEGRLLLWPTTFALEGRSIRRSSFCTAAFIARVRRYTQAKKRIVLLLYPSHKASRRAALY